MLTPGYRSLGQFTITTAGTQVGDWVDGLDGLLSLLTQFRLAYGSGGTTIKAFLQTSIDDGMTPIDIHCAAFTTASATLAINFSALTPKTTQIVPSDGALADNASIDGILGSKFRVKLVSTGTYAGSTILDVSADAK